VIKNDAVSKLGSIFPVAVPGLAVYVHVPSPNRRQTLLASFPHPGPENVNVPLPNYLITIPSNPFAGDL
jgi:hypothetical protein